MTDTTISGNGAAGVAGEADGIRVSHSSTLALGGLNSDGSIDDSKSVIVESNAGNGIAAFGISAVTIAGGLVQGNGGAQLMIGDGSEASLAGATVTQTTAPALPMDFAVQAMQSSRLLLMQGASIAGGAVAGGILAMSSSSLTTIGALVTNDSGSQAAIEASGSSNVLLAGANTVANTAANGTAVEIDHSSSLMQLAAAPMSPEFAGAPATLASAADVVTGAGVIQEQSSIDLGMGLVGGVAGLGVERLDRGGAELVLPPVGRRFDQRQRDPGPGIERVLQPDQGRHEPRGGRRQLHMDLGAGIPYHCGRALARRSHRE